MGKSDINYIILPSKIKCSNYNKNTTDLIDQTYRLWFDIWSTTYLKNGINKPVLPDDFFRQDFVPILKNNKEIMAIHLYSTYSLTFEAIFNQSYLKNNFNEFFFKKLQKENINFVMTMESLAVNPPYRKSEQGQSIVSTLALLGMKVFLDYTTCDAIIAPARTDVGVAQIAYAIGFTPIQKGLTLYNTPVDLIYFKREDKILFPNDILKKRYESLWKNRIDHLSFNEHIKHKKTS